MSGPPSARGLGDRIRTGQLPWRLYYHLLVRPGRELFGAWRIHLSRPGSFQLGGRSFRYAYRRYHLTFLNERAVELPVAWEFLKARAGAHVLEVGNVLSHYGPCAHDVVDKYERADRVVNADAADIAVARPYDAIISISTLEHVGIDEPKRDPAKAVRAVKHLLDSCLRPGGELFVTFGIGYNRELERAIREGEVEFAERHFLKRHGRLRNRWSEIGEDEAWSAKYGQPFPWGNVVFFGTARRG